VEYRRLALQDPGSESRLINQRLIVAIVLSVLVFAVVMGRLILLQVIEHEHFDSLSNRNRVDILPLAPQRGLIFDRNGVLLAENIPSFSLELVPEKVPDMDYTIATLSQILSLSEDDIADFKDRLKSHRRFQQVIVRQRMTEEDLARFAVDRYRLPGVDVVGRLIRHYPQGELFSHSVGYVGRINERDLQNIDQQNYKGTLQIGKTGVEKQYEDFLHGTVGYRQIETNVQGREVRELKSVPAIAGEDLFLNIDINLQRVASEALGDYNGSVVALDPRTGDVLSLVSKPNFDPNLFVTGISSKNYAALRDSVNRPLFDRALRGHYPPGSTLKPFVALAGLEFGVVSAQSETFCPGWYSLPGSSHRYRCWKSWGHDHVDMAKAIAQSCDVYFYDLAHALGIDRMHQFLDYFGFGHRTGVDMPSESRGLSPSREWKKATRNQAWFPGETLISGIGQGFNQTTPIQLAHATAALAMRGAERTPRLLRATRKPGEEQMQLLPNEAGTALPINDSRHWEQVINAMVDVTSGIHGTAQAVGNNMPFKIAGKTGTAQVFGIKQDEEYDASTLKKKLHDHALFIAFAPADKPEFVVAVVVENGGSGSKTAAPIAKKMIQQYFGINSHESAAD
jgi:penicillin-binding protein 2